MSISGCLTRRLARERERLCRLFAPGFGGGAAIIYWCSVIAVKSWCVSCARRGGGAVCEEVIW